jgi:hypothetical protein
MGHPTVIERKYKSEVIRQGLSYDPFGQVKQVEYKNKDIRYILLYDYYSNGILKSITGGDGKIISEIELYDHTGDMAQIACGNGIRTLYTYGPVPRCLEEFVVAKPIEELLVKSIDAIPRDRSWL